MSEQQYAEILLALSDIDMNILRMQKQVDELPHKKKILEVRHKIKELESKAAQVEKLAADSARVTQLLSDETELNESQIVATQKALDSSTEYRETSSLVSEMEMLANRKAKLEEDSLTQMEKQEKVVAVQAQVVKTAKQLAAEEQSYVDAYREAGGKLLQDISDLKHDRETLAAKLPQDMAERYLKAVEHKSGIGAAHLTGNQCSGCHSTLSEGQLAGLMESGAVGECPNCNRLIAMV